MDNVSRVDVLMVYESSDKDYEGGEVGRLDIDIVINYL